MKNLKKVIALVVCLSLLASMLVACTVDEIAVYNSLVKTAKANSYESDTSLKLGLDVKNIPASQAAQIKEYVDMINGSKLNIRQKLNQNQAGTVIKQQVDASVDVGGMSLGTSIWVDSNLTGAKPVMKAIVEVPPMLSMLMPAKYKNRKYVVADAAKMVSQSGLDTNAFKQVMGISKDVQLKVTDFLREYALEFDPGFSMVTRKEDKVLNGESVSVYQLSLDEQQFKTLMKYAVNNFAQSEKAMNFIRDIALMVMKSYPESGVSEEQFNKEFDKFKSEIPAFLEQFNKVMDSFNNVKLIGNKGINIEFAINGEGYVVNEVGTIDFSLSLKDILKAVDSVSGTNTASGASGTYNITLSYETNYKNINKDVKITLPKLTKTNSVTIEDLMKDTTPPAAPRVNTVKKTTTKVTGKAEIGAKITVKAGSKPLGTGTVNSKGAFSIKIKAQKAGTVLSITAKDKAGNVSKATKVIVKK